MGISNETMRAMIREYGGFELSDEELGAGPSRSGQLH